MKFAWLFLLALFVLPLVSADLGNFQQGNCVNIVETCSNCTYNNITSIAYPNSTFALNDASMSKSGSVYTYSFCNTSSLGTYSITGLNDLGTWKDSFKITGNGNSDPSGIVILGFSIVFILILGYLIYMLVYMLAHIITIDYDLLDVGATVGGYFMLLGIQMLQKYYLGNPDITSWLNMFVQIGIWTHVIIPMFALVISLTIGSYVKKKVATAKENGD